jgi:hypothetical protein
VADDRGRTSLAEDVDVLHPGTAQQVRDRLGARVHVRLVERRSRDARNPHEGLEIAAEPGHLPLDRRPQLGETVRGQRC